MPSTIATMADRARANGWFPSLMAMKNSLSLMPMPVVPTVITTIWAQSASGVITASATAAPSRACQSTASRSSSRDSEPNAKWVTTAPTKA